MRCSNHKKQVFIKIYQNHICNLRFIIFLFTLCCGPVLTSEYYRKVNNRIFDGDYKEARELIEKSKELYGDKGIVLYYMDMGFSLHLEGNYKSSNAYLHKAAEIIRLLYTKSLTREAISFLTSDSSLYYEGEDYEKVFCHIISALNYSFMGLYDDALVEARQVDLLISWLKTLRGSTSYKDDAFARYLSGIIYENGGEINDAHIAYMKALRAFEEHKNVFSTDVPYQLLNDIIRTAQILGFNDTIDEIKNKYPFIQINPSKNKGSMGEIVLVHYNGLIPQKIETYLEISLSKGMALVQSMEVRDNEQKQVREAMTIAKSIAFDENIAISYPKMEVFKPVTNSSEIFVEETKQKISSERVMNLCEIALKLFDEKMGRIMGKTIARAVIKFLLAKSAGAIGEKAGGEKYGWLTGFLAESTVKATMQALERPDIRGWNILPYEIFLARVPLPQGIYNIKVIYNGGTYYDLFENVEVKKGKIKFLQTRTR